jgi:hypothetical protein
MRAAPPRLDRTVFWAPWSGPGLEHLHLRAADGGYVANGVVLGVSGGRPFRLHYKVKCDADWRTRKVVLEAHGLDGEKVRILRSDGRGRWKADAGEALPQLEGCLDIDISATPFTNTLPVRRLALEPGQKADLGVAHIAAPALEIRPAEQRYTCLAADDRGGTVAYEGPINGFRADLPLDPDGLVIDYPDLFRRVYPV